MAENNHDLSWFKFCFPFCTDDQRKSEGEDWFGSTAKNVSGDESDGLHSDSVSSDSGDESIENDDYLTPSELNDQLSVRRGSCQQSMASGKSSRNNVEEMAQPCPQRPEALGKKEKSCVYFEI